MTADPLESVTAPRVARVGWETAFACMWAIAHIVHLWSQSGGRFTNVTGVITWLAATSVLLRPSDQRRLPILAVCQLLDVAWTIPQAPDHWHLVALVNLALVLGLVTSRSTEGLVGRMAPTLRGVVIVAYSAAALSKYNETFLDPVSSCAVYLADVASLGVTGEIGILEPAHVALSIGAESLVAIGLIVPRFRRAGVVLGVGFHLLVSLSPAVRVGDFTTTLFALFLLFLSAERVGAVVADMGTFISPSPIARLVVARPVRAAGALLVVGGLVGHVNPILSRFVLWFLITGYGVTLLRALVRTRSIRGERRTLGGQPLVGALPLALVVLLAASPYIGLRTTGVFTMFSNLRTEGPGDNHLLFPSVDLFGLQDDLFILDSASDDPVASWAKDGQALPRMSIAQRLHRDDALTIAGYDGLGNVTYGPDAATIGPPPWYQTKFLDFRPVAAGGQPICGN